MRPSEASQTKAFSPFLTKENFLGPMILKVKSLEEMFKDTVISFELAQLWKKVLHIMRL